MNFPFGWSAATCSCVSNPGGDETKCLLSSLGGAEYPTRGLAGRCCTMLADEDPSERLQASGKTPETAATKQTKREECAISPQKPDSAKRVAINLDPPSSHRRCVFSRACEHGRCRAAKRQCTLSINRVGCFGVWNRYNSIIPSEHIKPAPLGALRASPFAISAKQEQGGALLYDALLDAVGSRAYVLATSSRHLTQQICRNLSAANSLEYFSASKLLCVFLTPKSHTNNKKCSVSAQGSAQSRDCAFRCVQRFRRAGENFVLRFFTSHIWSTQACSRQHGQVQIRAVPCALQHSVALGTGSHSLPHRFLHECGHGLTAKRVGEAA